MSVDIYLWHGTMRDMLFKNNFQPKIIAYIQRFWNFYHDKQQTKYFKICSNAC